MGQRICALALEDERVRLVGAIAREGSVGIGEAASVSHAQSVRVITMSEARKSSVFPAENRLRVVIDFSSDEGAKAAQSLAMEAGAALVVGTTALAESTMHALRDASRQIPVIVASNTSLGVCVVDELVRMAAKMLGEKFSCSIVEAHHDKKKDAPSGTALRLAKSIREVGHSLRDDQIVAIRGGDVIGEHTIRFAGAGEYIEVTHRATNRDLFARGALTCGAWLAHQNSGWYSVQDAVKLAT